MAFGWCYDSPHRCSGKAQPGVRIFRDTMDDLVPELGDYGIYNCRNSRTGPTLSLHGEGRAWDAACVVPLLVTLGQFCVDAAFDLGIQRVICGFGPGKAPKEWDSREGERKWEDYSGPSHDDHCHIEFCWKSALNLTAKQVRDAFEKYWPDQDDDEEDFLAKLTEAEQQRVLVNSDKSYKALFDKVDGVEVNVIDLLKSSLQRIEAKLNEGRSLSPLTSPAPLVTPVEPGAPAEEVIGDHTHGAVEGTIEHTEGGN